MPAGRLDISRELAMVVVAGDGQATADVQRLTCGGGNVAAEYVRWKRLHGSVLVAMNKLPEVAAQHLRSRAAFPQTLLDL